MKILLHIAALTLVVTANAQGTLEAVLSYSPSGGANLPGTVGWTFQTTTNITVTDLGVFTNVIASQTNIQVGLWDSSSNLLGSATVTLGSPLTNSARYESINGVLCVPGTVYHLGAFSLSAPSIQFNYVAPGSGTVSMSSYIQLGGSAQSVGTGFGSPIEINGADGSIFLAPTFLYRPIVPEPSGLALLSLGGLAFAAVRRRTRF